MCGKRVKYICSVRKDLFGCFRIEEIRDNANETSLKEAGGIEMSTTVPLLHALHSLFVFIYLPIRLINAGLACFLPLRTSVKKC